MRGRPSVTLYKLVAVICLVLAVLSVVGRFRESGNKIQAEEDEALISQQEFKTPWNLTLDQTLKQTTTPPELANSSGKANVSIFDRYPVSRPCPFTVQRIGKAGDGGKNVCGFEEIQKLEHCVVYSFGINNEVSFEERILEQTNCTVHMHDVVRPWPNDAALLKKFQGRITYSDHGIGTNRSNSLKEIMTRNGHSFIDIMKMDIEGGEWNTLHRAVLDFPDGLPIGQLQVEIHVGGWKPPGTPEFEDWYRSLETAGLRTFYKEPNPVEPLICWEYSFINVKFGLFTMKKNLI